MSSYDYSGKTVFVSGGTSGINLGIAKRFTELGARVAVLGRNPEKAAAAAAPPHPARSRARTHTGTSKPGCPAMASLCSGSTV